MPSDLTYERIFDLHDQVAVVTGAAGGLGREITIGLAKYGASIIIADNAVKRAEETAAEIRKLHKKCLVVKTNVAESASIDRMTKKALVTFNRIDILVNAAGISKKEGPATELSERDWDEIHAVNLKGTFLCCQRIGQVMVKQGGGRIVNIGSVDSDAALPQLAAYSASKGGIVSLTKSLAVEWAKYNVRVNVIAPSEFDTQLLTRFARGHEKAVHAKWIDRAPIPRARGFIGKPWEIVGAVIFLVSDASTMVTGHVLNVDGGLQAE